MNRPYLRITVVKEPYYRGDPRPWQVYKPHRMFDGVRMGGYPTQQEAMQVADRLARRSAHLLGGSA